jgi:hypothetical protein
VADPSGGAELMRTMPSPKRPTPASDLDVHRSAHLWVQRHGDGALARARDMVEVMRKKGDTDGADVWLRIIVAIGTLGERPTAARH